MRKAKPQFPREKKASKVTAKKKSLGVFHPTREEAGRSILTTLPVTEVWYLTGNSRRKESGGSQFEGTQSIMEQKAQQQEC